MLHALFACGAAVLLGLTIGFVSATYFNRRARAKMNKLFEQKPNASDQLI